MSNQIHGDIFENEIIKSTANFPCIPELHVGKNKDICLCNKKTLDSLKENGYTDSLDIPKGIYNKFNFETNSSVKVISGNGIGCADIINFSKNVLKNPLDLIVGKYSQFPNYKEVNQIIVFHIKPDDYKKLWGSLDLNKVSEFVSWVKNIPKGPIAQAENLEIWKEKRDDLLEGTDSKLKIDAKIDSKNQRRVQCSFKLEDLLSSDLKRSIYLEKYNHNLILPYKIKNNPKRSFERKKKSLVYKKFFA